MTAYGHPRQVQRTFTEFYPHSRTNLSTYFGLGNHDYENNLEDCWGSWWAILGWKSDWCAHYMEKIMRSYIKNRNSITDFDPGSLAYSWTVGNLHFVQLQNNMLYQAPQIDIYDSQQWLRKNLLKAESENKIIIINQHKPKFLALEKFIEELNLKNICAIFAGHLHPIYGLFKNIYVNTQNKVRKIPAFYQAQQNIIQACLLSMMLKKKNLVFRW